MAAAQSAVGVLAGGRLTGEDAYAYGKFARAVLGTNDVDFRARPHSDEEASFLAAHVATKSGVTFADLEHANAVVLVGFEAEEEAPIVFLRLRKGVRGHGTRVYSVASHTSRGLEKLNGTLLPAAPRTRGRRDHGCRDQPRRRARRRRRDHRRRADGRVAGCAQRGCRARSRRPARELAWIPRRAGERGALEMGLLPNLLPGSRPLADAAARVDLAAAWGLDLV